MKLSTKSAVLAFLLFMGIRAAEMSGSDPFSRQWIFSSETSAVIYWQLGEISESRTSCVEYGKTESLGQSTQVTKKPRWSHFHRLSGLDPGSTYYYRMVVTDTVTNIQTVSGIYQFTLRNNDKALRIPGDLQGPPYILDQPDAYYILTGDITADGTAFEITATGVTLDLDGHTVTFGNNTSEQVFGVLFACEGKATLANGHIVQGARSKDYSCAVRSHGRPYPTEIFGISTDVHLKCAYPINFLNQASDLQIHHNHLYSRVTELESRHYPGNALLQVTISGGNIQIHDNLLTEGCHWGILLREGGINVEVEHNDIMHHQQYVNGYALAPCPGSDIHHNKVTSTGRGVHLTGEGILFHDNYFDHKGHMHLDDMPQGSRPFQHQMVELHGVKFEGNTARNCQVYNNFVRIVQKLPRDSDGQGLPEDKMDNGVYVRSTTGTITGNYLVDNQQNWEPDRWRNYYVKYSPDLPPARIISNDATSLYARFQGAVAGEYAIYMIWQYVPATPLNIACYDPNAMNQVYNNKFVALTEYSQTRHGDYGDSGQWASTIMFIDMTHGLSTGEGKYSIYIHNNQFVSNDLFFNGSAEVNMTVPLEDNVFTLVDTPLLTVRESRFRAVGSALEKKVKAARNDLKLTPESDGGQSSLERNPDFDGDGRLTIIDVVVLLIKICSEPYNPALDWNGDSENTTGDAIALLLHILSANEAVMLSSAWAAQF